MMENWTNFIPVNLWINKMAHIYIYTHTVCNSSVFLTVYWEQQIKLKTLFLCWLKDRFTFFKSVLKNVLLAIQDKLWNIFLLILWFKIAYFGNMLERDLLMTSMESKNGFNVHIVWGYECCFKKQIWTYPLMDIIPDKQ